MKNLKIGQKVLGMAGILLLLMVLCSVFGILKIGRVGEELRSIANEDIVLTGSITEITVNQLEQTIWFERALRFGKILADDQKSAEGLVHALSSVLKLSYSQRTEDAR